MMPNFNLTVNKPGHLFFFVNVNISYSCHFRERKILSVISMYLNVIRDERFYLDFSVEPKIKSLSYYLRMLVAIIDEDISR